LGSYSYDLYKDGWKMTITGIEKVDEIKTFVEVKKNKNQTSTNREKKR
jgi:hypothetical protein